MSLSLRNPHSVLAALEVRPDDVLEVRLPPRQAAPSWLAIAEQARGRGIPIRTELQPAEGRRGERGPKSERLGLSSAVVRERPGVPLESLWPADAVQAGGLWLALDCLQDPHNVGAIFRTAAFFGVRGVVLTRDRSAPLTATVYDVASGGLEHVPFSQPGNLAQTLTHAKDAGLWILGSSEHAPKSVGDIPRDRAWLLVIGNEEQGLRRLTLDSCDEICGIPPRGPLTSLNASVAAGVLIASLTGGLAPSP